MKKTETMTHQDIRRELISKVEAFDLVSQSEVEEVLGYKRPENTKVYQDDGAQALAELEIEVLNWKDVLRYQFEKRQQKENEYLAQVVMSDKAPGWISTFSWNETEIGKYERVIPDYVLNKAIQIKKALPEWILMVESLSESSDPFLVLKKERWGSQKYYVEVWDEPSFR